MEFGKCIEEVSEFCTALADAELLLGFAAQVWKLTSHLQRTYNVQFKGLRSTVGTLDYLQPHYSQRFDTHSLAWYYCMYWISLSAAEFLLLFVRTPSFGSHLSVTRGPQLVPIWSFQLCRRRYILVYIQFCNATLRVDFVYWALMLY